MGNMYGTDGKSTRELQVPITQHWKESNTKKIHGNANHRLCHQEG
jgi:hypothetical protein